MAKVIIGKWHDTSYQGEVWKRCSECKCESRNTTKVVRPTFVRVMCPACLEAFLDVENIMKAFDVDVLNDWYATMAIV